MAGQDDTTQRSRSRRASHSGNRQSGEGNISATEAMQRAADVLIAETQSFSKRYSQNSDSMRFSNQSSSYHQPRLSLSDLEAAAAFRKSMDDREVRSTSPSQQVIFPDFDGDSDSPAATPEDEIAFPALAKLPRRKPVPPPKGEGSSSQHRRRDSMGSGSSLADSHPPLEWLYANGSTPTLTGNNRSRHGSASQLDSCFGESPRAAYRRSFAGVQRPNQDFADANRSTTSLPGYAMRGGLPDGHTDEDVIRAANAVALFRASNATTLRQSYQKNMLDRESQATPLSFQKAYDIYIRPDNHVELATHPREESPSHEPPQDAKGQPGGPPLGIVHEVLFVFIIAAAQALMLAGVSQALIPATVIGSSFGMSKPADLAWFSAAYALTSGTFVLPSGRLGDLFGHKKIFVIGFFWFAVWSFITGFALRIYDNGGNGVIYFNVCRAIQGIGPALQVPNGQAMLGRAYKPGLRKSMVMCLFGAAAPFGFVAGGAMSSLLAQQLSWPWSFWVLALVCLFFGTLSIFILPNSPVKGRNLGESLWTELDAPGILFGVSGLVLFNFAWNQAAQVSWHTPYTYFILVISVMLISAFVWVELHTKYPLVPISAMRWHTNFVLACTAAGWGCFSIWVFYSFQFLEVLRGWSPLLAAASHGPGPITGLIASLLVARYMMRVGPHWVMLISMLAFFAGSLLMATCPVEQTYWANTLISVLIMPFGMDMSNPAATLILSNSVSKEHQGIAASLVVTVVNYSISTGLGLAATIETQVNKDGTDILAGFRGAQYFGVGLGALGCVIASAFTLSTVKRQRAQARTEAAEKSNEALTAPAHHTELSTLQYRMDT